MVNPGDDGIALKNKAPMESVDSEEIHLLSISESSLVQSQPVMRRECRCVDVLCTGVWTHTKL